MIAEINAIQYLYWTICIPSVKLGRKTHAYSAQRSESKKIEKSKRRKRIIPRA